MNLRKSFSLLLLLAITACTGEPATDAAPTGHTLKLPGALQSLGTCQGVQQLNQLEVRAAITGGVLDPRTLKLTEQDDGTIVAKADFELDGVNAERTESFALGIYGRDSDDAAWVLLATLEEDLALKPNQANSPKLEANFEDGCGKGYDAKTGALAAAPEVTACELSADLNRNGVSNLDDFCNGASPTPPSAFLNVNPSTVQFQSGIELGEFARQVVLLENLSQEAITLNAEVVGMPGLTIARLDPEYFELDGTARRNIESTEDAPFTLEPLSEMLVALSYAPVNGYLATGTLQVSAANPINVSQAFDITVIGNTDGSVKGVDPDYEVATAASTLADQLGLPLTPYPAEYLFSGLNYSASNVEVQPDSQINDFPVDAAYLFEVPADYRFSLSLTGLASDMDLGLFVLNSDGEIAESIFSQNAGTSSEAIAWRNETDEAVKAVLAISKVVERGSEEGSDGALTVFQAFFGEGDEATATGDGDEEATDDNNITLTAQLFAGPEFAEDTPMEPVQGPFEGGSTISLYGRGFQPGATVTVNDSFAFDVQVHPDGEGLRFTLPPASGGSAGRPVTIVVVNPEASEVYPDGDGQAATLAESFTYLPPRPVLLSASPNKVGIAGGTSVTVYGSYISGTYDLPAVCFGTTWVKEGITFTNSTELSVLSPEWTGVSAGEEETVGLTVRNWFVNPNNLETPLTEAQVCGDTNVTELSGFSNQLSVTFKAPEAEAPIPAVTNVLPSTGSIDGGDTVAISGSNFATDAIVYFGAKPASSVTRISDSELSVLSPAGDEDGIVQVTVVNVNDATTSNGAEFQYETPAPVVLSVLPGTGTTVAENTLAIEGTGFRTNGDGNYPKVSFTDTDEDTSYEAVTTQFLNSGRVLATTPEGMAPGFYTVTLTNPNGDEAESETNLQIQAPVAPAPTIDLISPSSGSMLGHNTAEIRGANLDETETPTVLVNGQALESVVATDSSALTLTMPPAEEAGAVTVRVVNSDGQSDTVTYTYLEDVADPPLYESINRTTFEVGDASQTLIAEFSQVQEPYRLTVTPLLTSGGFPSFNNGTLTYIHDDPCVDGVGPYVIEVANPDGQDANVAYYCAPAPEPQVTLQAKGWLYTQSGGDQLMVFGSNLHLVEKTEIRPVDDPNTSTVLCDGDCDFESNEAVVATPNDLTPDAFYEVVFRWTSPYDENQIAYWVSNPLFAGAPKAISASD